MENNGNYKKKTHVNYMYWFITLLRISGQNVLGYTMWTKMCLMWTNIKLQTNKSK